MRGDRGGHDGGSGCDKQVSGRLYGIRRVAHRVVARDVGSGGDMPISGGLNTESTAWFARRSTEWGDVMVVQAVTS